MSDPFGLGFLDPISQGSDLNQLAFIVESFLIEIRTAAIVLVKNVDAGAVGPIGTVDVQPLVNMVDGNFNAYPHGTIYGLPYMRVQGGLNAVICDPAVGDVGLAVICDRDISSLKRNAGAQSNPGSWRRHNLADGIYLFPIIAKTPAQYIEFTSTGINITDLNGNTIVTSASGISINGVLFDRSQNVTAANDVSLASGVTLNTHVHTGVQSGGSNTGGPTG